MTPLIALTVRGDLAVRVWDYSATDDEVSEGMRRTCGPSVIDMLYAANIHP
jgi:hypothetical protein